MELRTFADFAHLAEQCGASLLAAALYTCIPGQSLPSIEATDPPARMNRFRRAIERYTGIQTRFNASFATWDYGYPGQMIEGFLRLEQAVLAGIRHIVSPVEPLALRIATSDDWTWLEEWRSSGSNGSRIFSLYEDVRRYRHIPNANALLLVYTEPGEFGRGVPAPAGFCFFGDGLICIIESHYRGGGGIMIRWLQQRYSRLLAHHVLSEHSGNFFKRYGFVDTAPPLPDSAMPDIDRVLRDRSILFETARIMHNSPLPNEPLSVSPDQARQRIMAWPESYAVTPDTIAADLAEAGLKWWYNTTPDRLSFDTMPPTHRRRIIDFVSRTEGIEASERLLRRAAKLERSEDA